jgi:hypothetical protein
MPSQVVASLARHEELACVPRTFSTVNILRLFSYCPFQPFSRTQQVALSRERESLERPHLLAFTTYATPICSPNMCCRCCMGMVQIRVNHYEDEPDVQHITTRKPIETINAHRCLFCVDNAMNDNGE